MAQGRQTYSFVLSLLKEHSLRGFVIMNNVSVHAAAQTTSCEDDSCEDEELRDERMMRVLREATRAQPLRVGDRAPSVVGGSGASVVGGSVVGGASGGGGGGAPSPRDDDEEGGASSSLPPLSVATNGFRAPLRTDGSESGESIEIVTGKALTPDSEGAKSPRAATAALVLALD